MTLEANENLEDLEANDIDNIVDSNDIDVNNDDIDNDTQIDDSNNNDGDENKITDEERERIKQENIQKAINKKHFEAKQAQRELEEAKRKLAEYEKQQQEAQAKQFNNIPDLPDPFDDDYEEKLREREILLTNKAQYEAQQQLLAQQQQQQQYQQQLQQQQELQKQVVKYETRAKELGITQEELAAAGQTVAQYGISEDIAMGILSDQDGALITKYLADNPLEIAQLTSMGTVQAAMYLERNIRPKAAKLKPRKSNTPAPTDNITSSKVKTETKYKNISGAKFE